MFGPFGKLLLKYILLTKTFELKHLNIELALIKYEY